MKRLTKVRHRIIDWIGLRGAMPALRTGYGEPVIIRPEGDEAGLQRVGWPEFFAAVERRKYVFVYDDAETPSGEGSLDYQFVPKDVAFRELGLGGTYWAKHAMEVIRGLPVVQH